MVTNPGLDEGRDGKAGKHEQRHEKIEEKANPVGQRVDLGPEGESGGIQDQIEGP